LPRAAADGDQIGLDRVLDKMKQFQAQMGDAFKPAGLLEKLVGEKKKFADLR
jgi:3-hydroxyacyl-CoA dehydrogenase